MAKRKDKRKKPKKKRQELTYERKAMVMAREHWERQKAKAIKDRRTFQDLQIVPTASYYDESHGHKPGENNWTGFGFDLHPQVSLVAGALVLGFIVLIHDAVTHVRRLAKYSPIGPGGVGPDLLPLGASPPGASMPWWGFRWPFLPITAAFLSRFDPSFTRSWATEFTASGAT